MQELTITRPDDWHVHLRDGAALKNTVAHTARYFGRAIVMPNLLPPVTTAEAALAYRQRILAEVPADSDFKPLMTLYLTDNTSPEDIKKAQASGQIFGVKLYPAGATTNSDSGVSNIANVYACLEIMSELNLPLLVHGEVTKDSIDIFDREKVFIDTVLSRITSRFPTLKIVLEHITTKQAVEFVSTGSDNIAATITPQHLLYNRNHMLAGGIRPHFYCLPILKRNEHQQALLDIVASGNNKFFLGTDSAPHATDTKENACGCAGCFSAHAALELYAEVFDALNALGKLEAFASFNGPDFYELPRNSDLITLTKTSWDAPAFYEFADQHVTPLRAKEKLLWTILSD
ncbi:MAG: dihydroorotase [SAR86 cluster bacterium]|uniref:Dihydroorotase n=1 Tax=SAR86 cluster bacterium TaxID=2030880 RepID=A0A2A5C6V4_9GAMM|nr:MAG: dihydroorotase [SAR86 cluster bacterium]